MTIIKHIKTNQDIDNLREGEVVEIDIFARQARFEGIKDAMLVFSYRTGMNRISELWIERKDIHPSNDEKKKGMIIINPNGGPYEPIRYDDERNTQLYNQKDKELTEVGL